MTRAVCTGSFDPVTNGHLDVIERTAQIIDEVVVAVGTNIAKNSLFTPEERVEMLAEECAQWSNVEVTLFGGLLVDFCATNDIDVISKGLRAADLGYELQMAQMNRQLTGVDTLFLPTALGIRLVLLGPRGRDAGWRCDGLPAGQDRDPHHDSGGISKCGSSRGCMR